MTLVWIAFGIADTGGYWSKVPPKKTEDGDGITMDDLVL